MALASQSGYYVALANDVYREGFAWLAKLRRVEAA